MRNFYDYRPENIILNYARWVSKF